MKCKSRFVILGILLVATLFSIQGVLAAGEACFNHDGCPVGEYCDLDTCTTLSFCYKRDTTSNAQTAQSSSEDLFNECASKSVCDNQYTRRTNTGNCNGAGACASDSVNAVTAGDVCRNGISQNPSANTNCGTGAQNCYCDDDWYQCDTVNDCTYDQYYVGFTGGGACTSTGAVLRTSNVANTDGNRCKVGSTTVYEFSSSVWDTNTCATNSYCSSGVCSNVCPTLTGNTFEVQNSTGSACFEVDIEGNALIHGDLTQSCATAPPADAFVVRFGASVRGWVRDSDCDMCLYGTAADGQTVNYGGLDGFYVRDSGGDYEMKWDTSGNLNFEGVACYGYDSGAATAI